MSKPHGDCARIVSVRWPGHATTASSHQVHWKSRSRDRGQIPRSPTALLFRTAMLAYVSFWEISKEVNRLSHDWIREARRDLQALRGRRGQLGLQEGRSAERRAVGAFMRWACSPRGIETPRRAISPAHARTAEWIAAIQRADGSLPVSPEIQTPALDDTAMPCSSGAAFPGFEASRRRARNWLLRLEGQHPAPQRSGREAVRARLDGASAGRGSRALIRGSSRRRWRSWRSAARDCTIIRESRPGSTCSWTVRSSQAAGTMAIRPSSVATCVPQPGPSGLALLALAAHRR